MQASRNLLVLGHPCHGISTSTMPACWWMQVVLVKPRVIGFLTEVSNLVQQCRSYQNSSLPPFEMVSTNADLNIPLSDDFIVPTNNDVGATSRLDGGK